MALGVALLALGAFTNLVAFFGLRYLVARRFGAPRLTVAFGVEPAAWASASFVRRLLFTLSGPVAIYLTAALFLATGTLVGGSWVIDETSMRVAVAPGGAAADAHVEDGDRIVSVNGQTIGDWDTLKAVISKHAGEEIELGVERAGKALLLTPRPSAAGKIGQRIHDVAQQAHQG